MFKKILVFDKGGRKERIKLIEANKAPKDFLQGIDFLKDQGLNIKHLSSVKEYKKNLYFYSGKLLEKFFCRITNIGIRPLSVFQFNQEINSSDCIVSLTDGFSISLGFYYYFFNKKNNIKIVGSFHRLSDYNSKLPVFLKNIYFKIFRKILKRIDYIVFYGEADRNNAINHFKIPRKKTYILKFGVDTKFWIPTTKETFKSNYLFSIGQDPARDFNTLLKVKTSKKIHIHTSLLKPYENKSFKITNGTYHKLNGSLTDLEIRELYQESFAVIVPLKDVFQPSGYSVTLQAMACGKPVILTLTKGLWAPKIFKNLENCILVKPNSARQIEDSINLLEKEKNIYENISINAMKTAKRNFSLEKSYSSIYNLFKNIS